MIDLGTVREPDGPMPSNRMSDGSESFPYLWRYFLHHKPLRDWLMRSEPFSTASVSPRNVAQGIAFCCNFSVPSLWEDKAASFDLGEMFIPDHAYSHFMCGTMLAATSLHKHLVCALGPAASRNLQCMPSYQTCVRRMVVDMGSSRSINILEFSWMQDGALIVTAKILVPPDPTVPYQTAGCTGAFALFPNVTPGGPLPTIPRSLVSFVEVPRCPFCTARGSLGCYCSGSMRALPSPEDDTYSSAVWPPRIANDVHGPAVDTYHNIRSRLDLIQHIAHVKITAHVVTSEDINRPGCVPGKTYRLGPSRFVVKAVLFRPANSFEADTLRQVADKLRLLRAGSLRMQADMQKLWGEATPKRKVVRLSEGNYEEQDIERVDIRPSADGTSCPSISNLTKINYVQYPEMSSMRSSHVSSGCSACFGKIGVDHTCSLSPKIQVSEVTRSRTESVHASKVTETVSAAEMPTRRIPCPRCDKTFSQQGSLNRHLKNIHDARKIPCEFCNMAFGQMFDLKVSSSSNCDIRRCNTELRLDSRDTDILLQLFCSVCLPFRLNFLCLHFALETKAS